MSRPVSLHGWSGETADNVFTLPKNSWLCVLSYTLCSRDCANVVRHLKKIDKLFTNSNRDTGMRGFSENEATGTA